MPRARRGGSRSTLPGLEPTNFTEGLSFRTKIEKREVVLPRTRSHSRGRSVLPKRRHARLSRGTSARLPLCCACWSKPTTIAACNTTVASLMLLESNTISTELAAEVNTETPRGAGATPAAPRDGGHARLLAAPAAGDGATIRTRRPSASFLFLVRLRSCLSIDTR